MLPKFHSGATAGATRFINMLPPFSVLLFLERYKQSASDGHAGTNNNCSYRFLPLDARKTCYLERHKLMKTLRHSSHRDIVHNRQQRCIPTNGEILTFTNVILYSSLVVFCARFHQTLGHGAAKQHVAVESRQRCCQRRRNAAAHAARKRLSLCEEEACASRRGRGGRGERETQATTLSGVSTRLASPPPRARWARLTTATS